MKRTVTVQQEIIDCDRCGRKVTKSGGRIALSSSEGPVELSDKAGPDEFSSDLCRACKKTLEGWWARGREEHDQPDRELDEDGKAKPDVDEPEICGVRDLDHTCQLAPGHEGRHVSPSVDLSKVHEWRTPPEKPANAKGPRP